MSGLMIVALGAVCLAVEAPEADEAWEIARRRGVIYADCGRNVSRLLQGWIDVKQDPKTHLFSRGRTWDYHNEAADHYSSLVLMAFYVNPALIREGGALHKTLVSCRELCGTPSGIPTTYDLKTYTPGKAASLGALSEWLRDGLIRITEAMGTDNQWYRELQRLTDAMIAEADRRGGMVEAFRGSEPWGNMLQTLARLYAISGKGEYLRAAEEIADAVLFDRRRAIQSVRFRDHGCELVPGLGELFVLECKLGRPKARRYHVPMRELLDRTLQTGAHPATGLLCGSSKSDGGDVEWLQPPDTWGYVLFAYENYDRGTGEARYRAAIEKPLRWLVANYRNYPSLKNTLWPRSHNSDTWSDSHESMIVLWNRYQHVEGVFDWLDWATLQHKHRRFPNEKYGPFDGGHLDGSTGRSLCIHMMLCSQGVRNFPFAEGVGVGGVQCRGELLLTVRAEAPWEGRLSFDRPRNEYPTTTIDWARLNEMPQWFVVRPEKAYSVVIEGAEPATMRGTRLIDGLQVHVDRNTELKIRVRPVD